VRRAAWSGVHATGFHQTPQLAPGLGEGWKGPGVPAGMSAAILPSKATSCLRGSTTQQMTRAAPGDAHRLILRLLCQSQPGTQQEFDRFQRGFIGFIQSLRIYRGTMHYRAAQVVSVHDLLR
jgi:hypothetical protein